MVILTAFIDDVSGCKLVATQVAQPAPDCSLAMVGLCQERIGECPDSDIGR